MSAPAVTTPHADPGAARELISPALFGQLARRIVTEHGVDSRLAERIMTEALAFLYACAHSDRPLAPSLMVDIGWHTFILYTRDYARFCRKIAGRFLHHVPDDEPPVTPVDDEVGHRALRDTIVALTATGHHVDIELWTPTTPVATRCNGGGGSGTGKCSQCHAGCVNSP
ncbi:glycine-rich domain-containing protein [Actinocatenispora comari]|uniref:Uncharacterized protein n=1 Tax=Actinocatenispora comari TaxID=2807577 RepID=A0A8J4AI26_9ACTN|nr:hypothetical protein [Actinocatenispora comari]GIL29043.1 hypothetical protein NUM_42970 [Actinocatenispora comari]